ncbi:hypothetical protein L9F63_006217, partial [Diploptera punctata]
SYTNSNWWLRKLISSFPSRIEPGWPNRRRGFYGIRHSDIFNNSNINNTIFKQQESPCCRLPVPNLQNLRSWASSMLSALACTFSFHVNFGLPLFFFLYDRNNFINFRQRSRIHPSPWCSAKFPICRPWFDFRRD